MPNSTISFDHLGIAPKMLKLLDKLKFTKPTPIQHKAIPIGVEGKDIFGVAQTGTGKTLSFGIPTIQRLASMDSGQALIVAPTRELAIQIEEALKPLILEFNLKSVVLIGGVPMFRQIKRIRQKPRVIIATPGRLIDHMQQKNLNLNNVEIVILDEADRMFDMGFQPQVEEIFKKVKKKRQTLLFSATMPEDIVKLATTHMKLPIRIEVAPQGTTAEEISQELFIVKNERKKSLAKAILKEYRGPILVFVRTKIGAKKIKRLIAEMGYKVAEIHSDRTMGQRKQAIEGFKRGKFQILVATDIAARGIDISNIELVLNYDLPDDVESYVHRIGRTGRAGSEGHAISFAMPDQGLFVAKIEKIIRKPLPISQHTDISEKEWDEKNAKKPRNRKSRRERRKNQNKSQKKETKKNFSKKKPKQKGSKEKFKKSDKSKKQKKKFFEKKFGKKAKRRPGKRRSNADH